MAKVKGLTAYKIKTPEDLGFKEAQKDLLNLLEEFPGFFHIEEYGERGDYWKELAIIIPTQYKEELETLLQKMGVLYKHSQIKIYTERDLDWQL